VAKRMPNQRFTAGAVSVLMGELYAREGAAGPAVGGVR
jgi:hypothetical protein